MHINELVLEIGSYLPYLYSLLFVVSIGIFKKHTSLSLIIVILALAEFAMEATTLPLLSTLNNKSIEYVIRLGVWVLFWGMVDLLIIWLLQKTHIWLNISKGKELKFVQGAYILLIALLLVHFINRVVTEISIVDLVYHFGVPIINFTIAAYLLFNVLKHMELAWKRPSP